MDFGIVFENFSADMISAVAEALEASFDELKFHK